MQRRSIVVFVCFNSQPPEGGWLTLYAIKLHLHCFNSQPPEGGWDRYLSGC